MRARAFFAAMAAAGSTAACDGTAGGGGLPPPPGCSTSPTVWVLDVGFAPACVKVSPGAAVEFRNLDSVNHTVTGYAEQGEVFDSGLLIPGDLFTQTFAATPPEVQLRCSLHPATVGKVVVE